MKIKKTGLIVGLALILPIGLWVGFTQLQYYSQVRFIQDLPNYPKAVNLTRSNRQASLSTGEQAHTYHFDYLDSNSHSEITEYYDQYLLSHGWKAFESAYEGDRNVVNEEGPSGISDTKLYSKKLLGWEIMRIRLSNETITASVPPTNRFFIFTLNF